MVKYEINNFKGVANFTEMNWNSMLLNSVYTQRMTNYIPRDKGDLYQSEIKYATNTSLNIMYTAGHASTAYDGVYYGKRREPLRKWHSKATKEWVKVFTDDNQELIKRAFDRWVRGVIL